MKKDKGSPGRPRKSTQILSCRVPPEFKRDFEALAQQAGLSNGDMVVEVYNELQEALGEIRTLHNTLTVLRNAPTGPDLDIKPIPPVSCQ